MENKTNLYSTAHNPLLILTDRPLPEEVAVIGAGTIGPDIGYYLKSAMPKCRLFLVDVVEEPLKAPNNGLSATPGKRLIKKR